MMKLTLLNTCTVGLAVGLCCINLTSITWLMTSATIVIVVHGLFRR
jgi:hypothetical protein